MPRSFYEMTGSRPSLTGKALRLGWGILLSLVLSTPNLLLGQLGQDNPNNSQNLRSQRQQRLERLREERERQQYHQAAPPASAPAIQVQVPDTAPPPSTPVYSDPELDISQIDQAGQAPSAPPTGIPQEQGDSTTSESLAGTPTLSADSFTSGSLARSTDPSPGLRQTGAQGVQGVQGVQGEETQFIPNENTTQARHIRVLSDRIYVYSYFNVVFETPFEEQDTIAISPSNGFPPYILRNNTLIFDTYQDQDIRTKRSFTLGFYCNSVGVHRLPPMLFRRTTDNEVWQSESVDFAVFAPDEVQLALPVRLRLSEIPQVAYVGQDIVLSALAEYAEDLDQSWLNGPLELEGTRLRSSPILPGIQQQRVLGHTVYQIPLQSWVVTPLQPGALQIPALQAQIMGLERSTAPQQIQVLSVPPLPSGLGAPQPTPIGEFEVTFHINGKQSRFADNDLPAPALYALDETLSISYRISGVGNLAELRFPEVHTDPGMVFLQAQEDLQYKAQSGQGLEGYRTRTLYYRASEAGMHQVSSGTFIWFSPADGVWKQAPTQNLSVEFSEQFSQAYYPNLDQLWFSRLQIYWLSFCYLLQEYAFYFALIPVLLLLYFSFLPFLAENMGHLHRRYRKYNPSNSSRSDPGNRLHNPVNSRSVKAFGTFRTLVRGPWLLIGSFAIVGLALSMYAVHRLDIRLQQAQAAMQKGDIAAAQQLYSQLLSGTTQITTANPDSLAKQLTQELSQRPWIGAYTAGLLPNEVLLRYRQGELLEALQLAYLNYYLQPTHNLNVRLLSSLRNKIGLNADLPAGFLWWRIARHYWGFLGLLLAYGLFGHFLYQRRKLLQVQETQHYVPTPQQLNTRNFQILQLLRSHGLLTLLVLLSLTWRSERPTAVNIHPQQKLAPIPVAISLAENTQIAAHPQSILQQGELVLIQGTTMQADRTGKLHSFSLVNSESQKQGWISSKQLFFVPFGPSH